VDLKSRPKPSLCHVASATCSILLIMVCHLSRGQAAPPAEASPQSTVIRSATMPATNKSDGLTVCLYEGVDAGGGLIKPWPRWNGELSGGIVDQREQIVTVEIPDGRKLSQWSRHTGIMQFDGRIDTIGILPMPHSVPLPEANKSLHEILNRWKVEPGPDLARLLLEMDHAIPIQGKFPEGYGALYGTGMVAPDGASYWGGDQAVTPIGPNAELFVVVHPEMIFPNRGTYVLSLKIHASRKWYDAQWAEMEARGKVKRLAKAPPAPNGRIAVVIGQDADSVEGIAKPWPKTFGLPSGQYDDGRALTVTTQIPDGRRFSLWSRQTGIGRYQNKVSFVSMWPLPEPLPLREATLALERILDEWKIEPKGGIARNLQNLNMAIPRQGSFYFDGFSADGTRNTWIVGRGGPARSNWYTEKGAMDIGPGIQLHVRVMPLLTVQDRYDIQLEIAVATFGK